MWRSINTVGGLPLPTPPLDKDGDGGAAGEDSERGNISETQFCIADYCVLCIKGVDHLEYSHSSSAFYIQKLINKGI
jgi:hypothetical protein